MKDRDLMEEEGEEEVKEKEKPSESQRDADWESERRKLFRERHSALFDASITERYFLAKEQQIFSRYLFFYPNGLSCDIDLSKLTIPPFKL